MGCLYVQHILYMLFIVANGPEPLDQRYESGRSCMKLDGPKGLKVDGLRVSSPKIPKWTVMRAKMDGL